MKHVTPESAAPPIRGSRVVVQRRLAAGAQGGLKVPAVCRLVRWVRLVDQLVSLDGRDQLYIFDAPDAEMVRELIRSAWPDDDVRVWTSAT